MDIKTKPNYPSLFFSISFIALAISLIFFFQSCKKADVVNEHDAYTATTAKIQANDFFTISEKAPDALKVIVGAMQRQFKESDVKDFLNWYGQPLWSKIIRFEKDKNGSVTYAIPTQKNIEITGFFAATIDKSNAIKFEMHRQTAVELKKGEYSYANITGQQSKTLLDYFSGKSEYVFEGAASENTSSTWSCYWQWVEVTTLQETNGNQQNMEDPGGYWELRCIYQGGGGGGGTGGGDPGGGGGGGGSTGGCGGGGGNTEVFNFNWWNNEASLLTPCELIAVINRLSPILNLTALQIHYLMARPDRAEEIDRYLYNNAQNIQIAKDHLNKLTQDIDYDNFVENHAQTGDPMKMWWEDDTFLTPWGGINFGGWAINYISQHPTVSFAVFKNQFMSIVEGKDGEAYDANYWNDPNLTFPPQTLPSYAIFEAVYPKHNDPLYDTPEELYTVIGGNVLAQYNTNPPLYQNTCALRISRALNYSGIVIPNIPGKTFKGADNKYYFLGAATITAWMKKTFGTPTGSNHLTGTQGGTNGQNFPTLLAGKKGIYSMIPNYPGLFGASGHTDIINNSTCDGGCYFDADPGGVFEILIWELQ